MAAECQHHFGETVDQFYKRMFLDWMRQVANSSSYYNGSLCAYSIFLRGCLRLTQNRKRLRKCPTGILRLTQPSTLHGMVKWVPAKGWWCSAAGESRQTRCGLQVKLCVIVWSMS